MNQCVPSWDLDDRSSLLPVLDYEVAELTWKNGQVAMQGLSTQSMVNKPTPNSSPVNWEKPLAGGTLESIVNQATRFPYHKIGEELVPWLDHNRNMVNPTTSTSVTMTMDALVPCNNNNNMNETRVPSAHVLDSGTCVVGCSTKVGSCSAVAATTFDDGVKKARLFNSCDTNGSSSESATCGQDTVDSCDKDFVAADFTSPSAGSPDNNSSGKEFTKSIEDDRDSVYHKRRLRNKFEEDSKKRSTGKSSILTKRSRAAAIHNQSERKRRDRINQRMKTLQRLVPNSSKTDKASMLDEVIEYVKQLQAQVQLMRMNTMLPAFASIQQQQLHMSMMAQMGMNMIDMGRSHTPFMPPTWDNTGERLADPMSAAFLAWQSQLMTIDAYNRFAAMYQHFPQPSKNQL